MRAAEQLANVESRLAWEIVDRAALARDDMAARERGRHPTARARVAARRARVEAEHTLRASIGRADDLIGESLKLLAKLLALEETIERANLVGSAYKRRALVDIAAGRPQATIERDLREMKRRYEHAVDVARTHGAADLAYPAANCLAADVALHAGRASSRRLDARIVGTLRQSLAAKTGSEADFWSVVGGIELKQCEALAEGRLVRAQREFDAEYQDLHRRVASTRMWSTVYDTACLILPPYADRASAREAAAARALLAQLRKFAHPDDNAAAST